MQEKQKGLVVWLDDLRDPKDYGHTDAIWVKSAKGIWGLYMNLQVKGITNEVTEIHFDNDLGPGYDGYYVFTRLESMIAAGGFKGLKAIYVHTSNPAAAQKFMLAKEHLASYGIELIRKHY